MSDPTPAQIEPHAHRFKSDAWRGYSINELGGIVAFFCKRSSHRDPSQTKRIQKDAVDATNYTSMLIEHVNEVREKAGLSPATFTSE